MNTDLKETLPDTTQGAYAHGRKCHQDGQDISYNPYRHLPNRINHLWSAWNRGWKSIKDNESPDQDFYCD